MKRTILLLIDIVLFIFYSYGFYQWLQSGHDFTDVWRAITSDWFLAITVFDMSLFSLLAIIWLYQDMQKRKISGGKRVLIILATLIAGVVTLLVYLAYRKDREAYK